MEFNSLSKTPHGLAEPHRLLRGNQDMVGALKQLKSNMDYGMFIRCRRPPSPHYRGPGCVATTNGLSEGRTCCAPPSRDRLAHPTPDPAMFLGQASRGFDNNFDFAMELVERTGVMVTPAATSGRAARALSAWRWCRTRRNSCRAPPPLRERDLEA